MGFLERTNAKNLNNCMIKNLLEPGYLREGLIRSRHSIQTPLTTLPSISGSLQTRTQSSSFLGLDMHSFSVSRLLSCNTCIKFNVNFVILFGLLLFGCICVLSTDLCLCCMDYCFWISCNIPACRCFKILLV